MSNKVSGGGSRMVFGGVLVLVGLLLLFAQFDLFDFGDMVTFLLPVLLMVFALWQWAIRRFRPCFWPIFLLIISFFWLAARLDLFSGRGFGVLAGLVLIAFGIWLVIRKARPEPSAHVSTSDAVDHWVIFGGVEEELTSQQFSGGNVTVVFGGGELNLARATLGPGEVTLNLTVVFGGIDIRVPESWNVMVDATAILGGVENKTATHQQEGAAGGGQPCLRIQAVAIFGGVEIKN